MSQRLFVGKQKDIETSKSVQVDFAFSQTSSKELETQLRLTIPKIEAQILIKKNEFEQSTGVLSQVSKFSYPSTKLLVILKYAKSEKEIKRISSDDINYVLSCFVGPNKDRYLDKIYNVFSNEKLKKLACFTLSYLAQHNRLTCDAIKFIIQELIRQDQYNHENKQLKNYVIAYSYIIIHKLEMKVNSEEKKQSHLILRKFIRKLIESGRIPDNIFIILPGLAALSILNIQEIRNDLNLLKAALVEFTDHQVSDRMIFKNVKYMDYAKLEANKETRNSLFFTPSKELKKYKKIVKSSNPALTVTELKYIVGCYFNADDLVRKKKSIFILSRAVSNGQFEVDKYNKDDNLALNAFKFSLNEDDRRIKTYAIIGVIYVLHHASSCINNPQTKRDLELDLFKQTEHLRYLTLISVNNYFQYDSKKVDKKNEWETILRKIVKRNDSSKQVKSLACLTLFNLLNDPSQLKILLLEDSKCVEISQIIMCKAEQNYELDYETINNLTFLIESDDFPLEARHNSLMSILNLVKNKRKVEQGVFERLFLKLIIKMSPKLYTIALSVFAYALYDQSSVNFESVREIFSKHVNLVEILCDKERMHMIEIQNNTFELIKLMLIHSIGEFKSKIVTFLIEKSSQILILNDEKNENVENLKLNTAEIIYRLFRKKLVVKKLHSNLLEPLKFIKKEIMERSNIEINQKLTNLLLESFKIVEKQNMDPSIYNQIIEFMTDLHDYEIIFEQCTQILHQCLKEEKFVLSSDLLEKLICVIKEKNPKVTIVVSHLLRELVEKEWAFRLNDNNSHSNNNKIERETELFVQVAIQKFKNANESPQLCLNLMYILSKLTEKNISKTINIGKHNIIDVLLDVLEKRNDYEDLTLITLSNLIVLNENNLRIKLTQKVCETLIKILKTDVDMKNKLNTLNILEFSSKKGQYFREIILNELTMMLDKETDVEFRKISCSIMKFQILNQKLSLQIVKQMTKSMEIILNDDIQQLVLECLEFFSRIQPEHRNSLIIEKCGLILQYDLNLANRSKAHEILENSKGLIKSEKILKIIKFEEISTQLIELNARSKLVDSLTQFKQIFTTGIQINLNQSNLESFEKLTSTFRADDEKSLLEKIITLILDILFCSIRIKCVQLNEGLLNNLFELTQQNKFSKELTENLGLIVYELISNEKRIPIKILNIFKLLILDSCENDAKILRIEYLSGLEYSLIKNTDKYLVFNNGDLTVLSTKLIKFFSISMSSFNESIRIKLLHILWILSERNKNFISADNFTHIDKNDLLFMYCTLDDAKLDKIFDNFFSKCINSHERLLFKKLKKNIYSAIYINNAHKTDEIFANLNTVIAHAKEYPNNRALFLKIFQKVYEKLNDYLSNRQFVQAVDRIQNVMNLNSSDAYLELPENIMKRIWHVFIESGDEEDKKQAENILEKVLSNNFTQKSAIFSSENIEKLLEKANEDCKLSPILTILFKNNFLNDAQKKMYFYLAEVDDIQLIFENKSHFDDFENFLRENKQIYANSTSLLVNMLLHDTSKTQILNEAFNLLWKLGAQIKSQFNRSFLNKKENESFNQEIYKQNVNRAIYLLWDFRTQIPSKFYVSILMIWTRHRYSSPQNFDRIVDICLILMEKIQNDHKFEQLKFNDRDKLKFIYQELLKDLYPHYYWEKFANFFNIFVFYHLELICVQDLIAKFISLNLKMSIKFVNLLFIFCQNGISIENDIFINVLNEYLPNNHLHSREGLKLLSFIYRANASSYDTNKIFLKLNLNQTEDNKNKLQSIVDFALTCFSIRGHDEKTTTSRELLTNELLSVYKSDKKEDKDKLKNKFNSYFDNFSNEFEFENFIFLLIEFRNKQNLSLSDIIELTDIVNSSEMVKKFLNGRYSYEQIIEIWLSEFFGEYFKSQSSQHSNVRNLVDCLIRDLKWNVKCFRWLIESLQNAPKYEYERLDEFFQFLKQINANADFVYEHFIEMRTNVKCQTDKLIETLEIRLVKQVLKTKLKNYIKKTVHKSTQRIMFNRLFDRLCKKCNWNSKKFLNFQVNNFDELQTMTHLFDIAYEYRLDESSFYELIFKYQIKSSQICLSKINVKEFRNQAFNLSLNGSLNTRNVDYVKNDRNQLELDELKRILEKENADIDVTYLNVICKDVEKVMKMPQEELTTKQQIIAESKKLKNLIEPSNFNKHLVDVLYLIRCACSVAFKENNIESIRLTQILAVLIMLEENPKNMRGRLAQISTGEGKSLTIAALAVIKCFQSFTVDIITSSPLLARRDAEFFREFYSLFELTVASNEDVRFKPGKPKSCYDKHIVYGNADNFQYDYLRHEFSELNTRNTRKFEIVIVDEVDNMLIDDGTKIAMLSDTIPGMENLLIVLFDIWIELLAINERIVPRINDNDKYVYYIPKISDGNSNKTETLEHEKTIEFVKTKLVEYLDERLENESTYIATPTHLKEFVKNQKDNWISSALLAYYEYNENKHYTIEKDEYDVMSIKPVDYQNTGLTQNNSKWSDGLQQFLQIKHGLYVTSENIVTNFISNISYIHKYKKIYGLTGTLGSKCSQEHFKKIYKEIDLVVIPNYKQRCFVEIESIFENTEEKWLDEILNCVKREIKVERVVLLICETIEKAQLILSRLKEASDINPKQIKEYIKSSSNSEREHQFIEQEFYESTVVVATNLAGRGTDLKISGPLNLNGGIHVCFTYLPANKRIKDQGDGRGARKGNPGTAQMIVNLSGSDLNQKCTDLDVHQINEHRDKMEINHLEIMISEAEKTIEQDELFEMFINLLKDIKKLDLDTNNDKNSFIYRFLYRENVNYKRLSIEEMWGFWLKKINNNNNCKNKLAQFDEFRKQVLKLYKENKIIQNSYLCTTQGNRIISTWQRYFSNTFLHKSIHQYNKAIEIDSLFSYMAQYNKVFALLKLKDKDTKRNCIQVLNEFKKNIDILIGQLNKFVLKRPELEIYLNSLDRSASCETLVLFNFRLQILNELKRSAEAHEYEIELSEKLIDLKKLIKLNECETLIKKNKDELVAYMENIKDREKYTIDLVFRDLGTHDDLKTHFQAKKLLDTLNDQKCSINITFNESELKKCYHSRILNNLLSIKQEEKEKTVENTEKEKTVENTEKEKTVEDTEKEKTVEDTEKEKTVEKAEEKTEANVRKKRELIGLGDKYNHYKEKILTNVNKAISNANKMKENLFKKENNFDIPVCLSVKIKSTEQLKVYLPKLIDLCKEIDQTDQKNQKTFTISNLDYDQIKSLFSGIEQPCESCQIEAYKDDHENSSKKTRKIDHDQLKNISNKGDEKFKATFDKIDENKKLISLFANMPASNPALFKFKWSELSSKSANRMIKEFYELQLDLISLSYENLDKQKAIKVIEYTEKYNRFAQISLNQLDVKQAINLLKKVNLKERDLIVNDTKSISDIFENQYVSKYELEVLNSSGFMFMYYLTEKSPKQWLSVALVTLLGVLQIAGGVTIGLTSFGSSSYISSVAISEGINDIFRASIALYRGNFNWYSYGVQKSISIAMSVATGLFNAKCFALNYSDETVTSFFLGQKMIKNSLIKSGTKLVQVGINKTISETSSLILDKASSLYLQNQKPSIYKIISNEIQLVFNDNIISDRLNKLLQIDSIMENNICLSRLNLEINQIISSMNLTRTSLNLGGNCEFEKFRTQLQTSFDQIYSEHSIKFIDLLEYKIGLNAEQAQRIKCILEEEKILTLNPDGSFEIVVDECNVEINEFKMNKGAITVKSNELSIDETLFNLGDCEIYKQEVINVLKLVYKVRQEDFFKNQIELQQLVTNKLTEQVKVCIDYAIAGLKMGINSGIKIASNFLSAKISSEIENALLDDQNGECENLLEKETNVEDKPESIDTSDNKIKASSQVDLKNKNAYLKQMYQNKNLSANRQTCYKSLSRTTRIQGLRRVGRFVEKETTKSLLFQKNSTQYRVFTHKRPSVMRYFAKTAPVHTSKSFLLHKGSNVYRVVGYKGPGRFLKSKSIVRNILPGNAKRNSSIKIPDSTNPHRAFNKNLTTVPITKTEKFEKNVQISNEQPKTSDKNLPKVQMDKITPNINNSLTTTQPNMTIGSSIIVESFKITYQLILAEELRNYQINKQNLLNKNFHQISSSMILKRVHLLNDLKRIIRNLMFLSLSEIKALTNNTSMNVENLLNEFLYKCFYDRKCQPSKDRIFKICMKFLKDVYPEIGKTDGSFKIFLDHLKKLSAEYHNQHRKQKINILHFLNNYDINNLDDLFKSGTFGQSGQIVDMLIGTIFNTMSPYELNRFSVKEYANKLIGVMLKFQYNDLNDQFKIAELKMDSIKAYMEINSEYLISINDILKRIILQECVDPNECKKLTNLINEHIKSHEKTEKTFNQYKNEADITNELIKKANQHILNAINEFNKIKI